MIPSQPEPGPEGSGPAGRHLPVVYVISDSIGETAEMVVRAAASQFNSGRVQVKRQSYVDTPGAIDRILAKVEEERAAVVFTLVLPELRDYLLQQTSQSSIPCVDVMGPTMEVLRQVSHIEPRHEPGIIHRLDEDYFRRVDAIEFAVKYDDGRDPSGLLKADIVLVGVSRTSKTPVSLYLAHRQYKVANVPLVPEVNLPEELYLVDPKRIIGLRIRAEKLQEIRRERLLHIGLDSSSSYGNMQRISEELQYADQVFTELGCQTIDVSNKAVEETANRVLKSLEQGGVSL